MQPCKTLNRSPACNSPARCQNEEGLKFIYKTPTESIANCQLLESYSMKGFYRQKKAVWYNNNTKHRAEKYEYLGRPHNSIATTHRVFIRQISIGDQICGRSDRKSFAVYTTYHTVNHSTDDRLFCQIHCVTYHIGSFPAKENLHCVSQRSIKW